MAEEGEMGGVASEPASAFHYTGSSLLSGIGQLGAAIESMDTPCHSVAGGLVVGLGGSYCAPGNASLARLALHAGKRLAHIKAERCVQREGSIVKGGLDQPHPGGSLLLCAIQRSLHELAAGSSVLQLGIDGDGANTMDYSMLSQDITAYDPAIALRHHGVKAGGGKHHRQ
jgi:hypothetical protein